MKTSFVQCGEILNVVAPADVVAGDLFFRGVMCLQYVSSVLAGQMVGARRLGVIRLVKDAADVFDVATGAQVHWSNATGKAVTVATDGVVGTAVDGGKNGDLFVDVILNG